MLSRCGSAGMAGHSGCWVLAVKAGWAKRFGVLCAQAQQGDSQKSCLHTKSVSIGLALGDMYTVVVYTYIVSHIWPEWHDDTVLGKEGTAKQLHISH